MNTIVKTYISFSLFMTLGLSSQVALAEKPEKMNERQHMDNRIQNKIANARLRGMLAGKNVQEEINETLNEGDACITQIGNISTENSEQPADQDIIILGDVINICK